MAPAKMFPRGGQLVSTGQKTKRVMSKVKKQQGKKNDLFAEKRVFKEQITPALREKFKGRTQKENRLLRVILSFFGFSQKPCKAKRT